jgi:hypothetical protein
MRKNFHETYLLIGLYRDYGYFKEYEKREKVHKKLKIRWRKGIDRDAFEEYFKFYGVTKEDFDLE